MLNKKALHWAVAAALGGLGAAGAHAAATVYASELASGSQLAGSNFGSATTLYAPTGANPLYLQYSLSGGASYVTSPTLTCTGVSGGGSGTIAAGNIQLAAGGVGTGVATFVVTAVSAAAQINGCTITNGAIQVGTWPGSVSENVVLTYGNNLAPTGSNSTALLGASSFFSNAAGVDTNTALVGSGFVSFATATNTATNTYTARLGRFTITVNDNKLATGGAANASGITAYVTSMTITLDSPALAGSTTNSGQVFVTYNSGAVSARCTDTLIVSAAGGASTITFSAFLPGAATANASYAVCMQVTGGTGIPAGDVTVGVTGVPNTDPNHPSTSAFQISSLLAAGTKIGVVTRNGSSTTVLNIPRSADTDAGFLRVYNTSTNAGSVTATIYSQGAGATSAIVTNCNLSSSLGANQALVMSTAQIESALVVCGGTVPTAGRYRIDINGSFPTMRAQAFARSNGTLTNISGDTSTMGN